MKTLFSVLLHLDDGMAATLATLRSIAECTPTSVEYDTLIFDDGTTDGTQELLTELSGTVTVIRSESRVGVASALGRLVRAASTELVVVLKQGAVLTPGWHSPLLSALDDAQTVGVQSLVLDSSGIIRSAGLDLADDGRPVVRWSGHGFPDDLPSDESVDCLDGVCVLLRADWLQSVGGLDGSYPPGEICFADVSRRLTAAGAELRIANASRVIEDHPPDVETGLVRFMRLAPERQRSSRKVTTIALYLPAFHRIPENDRWWGDGFTEWTNVIKAQPLFEGHEQPRLPADLGLYDLRLPQARAAQAETAERFGIGAFCYYHYWFHGRRLLEQPFADVLGSGDPALPFCLCWANEDWRANWDGSSGELLMGQEYSEGDDLEHISWLCEVFRDPRYLRVNGKPIFLIYRARQLPDPAATLALWRAEAARQGIGELFLCRVESFSDEHDDPRDLGFDASVEFQPDWAELGRLPGSTGPARALYDYQTFARHMLAKPDPDWRRIPCVTPHWDNTARRGNDATVLINSSPGAYRSWVETVSRREELKHPDSPLLFVNAWNEWGEGAHLEPDSRWGTAYLEAHRDGTRAGGRTITGDIAVCVAGLDFSGVADAARWLHSCGLAIDHWHDLAPSAEHAGDAFSAVNALAISRQWPGSHGWNVAGDVRCWLLAPEKAQAIAAVQARRRSHPQWGWADPRSTLLFESWADIVPELNALLLWRPCLEVAADLIRSTASTPQPIGLGAAVACWLAYNRRVIEYRNLYPERCVLAPASAVSSAPDQLLAMLAQKTGLKLRCRPSEEPTELTSTAAASDHLPLGPGRSVELAQAVELEFELSALSDL